MATNYGKLDFAVAFNRQTAYPLDGNAYFESKATADAAIENAKAAGSSSSQYYYGQLITVYENGAAKVYQIQKQNDNKAILAEIGGKVDLDGQVTGPNSATDNAIALYDGTSGEKIKNSGATIDANRNLKFNGPGNISWEDGSYFQRIQITDDSAQNTAVFTFQQTEDTGKTWSNLFTIQDRGTIVAKNSTGGALSLTLDRGSNANWRWLSDNGNFIAQCDYTSSKVNYFNVLTMAYNTGNVSVDKGTLTSKGGFIHGNLTVPTGKSKNDYVLLAGGGSKALSEFGIGTGGSLDLSNYVKKSSFSSSVTGYLPKIKDANTIEPGYAINSGTTWGGTDSTVATTLAIDNRIKSYYWANVKISATSNTETSPTVKNLSATTVKIGNVATWQYNSSTDCVELVWQEVTYEFNTLVASQRKYKRYCGWRTSKWYICHFW